MASDNRRDEVLVVALLFLGLSWVSVCLRFYVRGVLKKTWGKDDTFMGVTLVLFTVYLAFQITAALYGTGRHRWELSDEDARISLLFWYLCELAYTLVSCTLKFSIGYFYLRVAMQRWHIWAIYILMSGTILFSSTYFFLVMFQCKPISEFWDNRPASSKCLVKGPTLGITYALSSVNAAADWALGILPLFMVWNLAMPHTTKALVVGILAFAAIGSTATVIRAFYIHHLVDGEDFLHATTDVAIWSTVEPGVGIVASSMATLRPLFRKFVQSINTGSETTKPSRYFHSNLQNSRRHRRGYRRSLSPSDLVPTQMSSFATEIHSPRRVIPEAQNYSLSPISPNHIKSNGDEPLTPSRMGHIMQTRTVEQEWVESPPTLELRESFRSLNTSSIFDFISRSAQTLPPAVPLPK